MTFLNVELKDKGFSGCVQGCGAYCLDKKSVIIQVSCSLFNSDRLFLDLV